MTTNTKRKAGSGDSSYEDPQETAWSPRRILTLFTWWREVALGSVLVAVMAGALVLALQVLLPQYEATADVVIIPLTTQVSLDNKLRTGGTGGNRRGVQLQARRAALVGLVRNGEVARTVVRQMKEETSKSGEEEKLAADVLRRIDAQLVTQGRPLSRTESDLIRIKARAGSPARAAALASTWAEEYVKHVNEVYHQVPAGSMKSLTAEQEDTRKRYMAVQEELETFIYSGRIADTERQIAEKNNLLRIARRSREDRSEALLRLVEEYDEAHFSKYELFTDGMKADFKHNHNLQQRLTRLVESATAFRSQIENSNANDLSDTFTLLLLKASAYVDISEVEPTLDLAEIGKTSSHTDRSVIINDLDTFIVTLQDRIQKLQMEPETTLPENFLLPTRFEGETHTATDDGGKSTGMLDAIYLRLDDLTFSDTEAVFIDRLEEEIRTLKRDHFRLSSEFATLQERRDRHREALRSLENEIIELQLTMASMATQVRFTGRAATPLSSTYPSPLLVSGLGWIAGLLMTCCFALLLGPKDGLYLSKNQNRIVPERIHAG